MKQFTLMTIGFQQPTPEIMEKWMSWFNSIKDKVVSQVGFMPGKEVFLDRVEEIPMDKNMITGAITINAEDIEEALNIAKNCPMVSSTKVYEVRNH